MDKKTIITFLLAGVAGVLIGHFAWTTREPPAATHESGRRPRAHVVDADSSATIATLRRRVHELEQRLADTAASAGVLTNRTETHLAGAEARPHGGPPNSANWRANLEEMKVKDPERYAQTTNRMAQWRSRMLANTQDRLEFFASLDTSTMTPKQRENHERLQDLLVRREELMQLMDISNDSITAAQREKARKEMFGLMGQLHAAERTERDMLLHQAARNLGCKGAVAKELVDTVKTIYDATQSWGGGGRRHGGGGRPPHPPPQR